MASNNRQIALRARLPGSARLIDRVGPENIALTFDDGPDPGGTPEVLEALRSRRAKATFFVLVDRARRYPELIESIVSEGHEVGLHADVHERLDRIPPKMLLPRFVAAREELEQISRTSIRLHRPPFGRTSLWLLRTARRSDLQVALWSHTPRDWESISDDELARRMEWCIEPGAVVLLHDGSGIFHERPAATRLIGSTIDNAAQRGLEPTTVSGT